MVLIKDVHVIVCTTSFPPQLSLIPSPWFLLPYSSLISSYFWLQFIIPEVSILMKIVGFWYTLSYKTTGSCLFCHLVKKQKMNKKQQQQKTPQQQEGWSWWKWRWEHQDSSLWTPSPWTPAQCLFIQLESQHPSKNVFFCFGSSKFSICHCNTQNLN